MNLTVKFKFRHTPNEKPLAVRGVMKVSGRQDLNLRPLGPELNVHAPDVAKKIWSSRIDGVVTVGVKRRVTCPGNLTTTASQRSSITLVP